MKNKIGFISLGCCKNLVDAERIMTVLQCNGYKIVPNYEESDLIIINTCGFINPSIDESFESITEAIETGKKIIITGCLGRRAEFIRENFTSSQIAGITGPHSYDEVFELVSKTLPLRRKNILYAADVPNPGIKLTPSHYAYLKISEGCSNKCSFCTIPFLRGPMKSRKIDDIMGETDRLIENGVQEIMVVAQDTLDYGRDLNYETGIYNGKEYKSDFLSLLEFLSQKDIWVRLHYLYPYPLLKRIIPYLKDTAIVPYLDIPLQHSSPDVLKRMRRPGNISRIADEINSWKEEVPDLCIRSSFIVGFPGETEKDFENLLEFIQEAKLQRVGCFRYSDVYGVAANNFEDQIPEEVKEERWNRFMQVQKNISDELMASKIGQEMDIIVDDVESDDAALICRSKYDSPEIDGNVFVEKSEITEELIPGDIFRVRITEAEEYDLWGEPVLQD